MQKELIITPIVAEGQVFNMTTRLGCDFKDGGDRVIINNQWDVIRGRTLSTDEVLMEFMFTPHTHKHIIRWDSEKNKAQDKAMEILKRHPQIQFPGNTNLKQALFKMTNSLDEKIARVSENKKKLMISNMISNMPLERVRDIAFWNKVPNASGLDAWDLFDKLIDMENGVLLKNPNHFLENYKIEGIDRRILAEKAIALKIITDRNGFLYYENTQLGKNVEDVVDYMMQNKEQGDYIKKDVFSKDKFPAEWSSKTVIEAISNVPTVLEITGKTKAEQKRAEDDDMELLKFDAKALGIAGAHLMKRETLIAKIAEAQSELAKAVTTT